MSRTTCEYDLHNLTVAEAKRKVLAWFSANAFRVLDEDTDGMETEYSAPELRYGRGDGRAKLRIQCLPGSILAVNSQSYKGADGTPSAYAVKISTLGRIVRLHGEFFTTSPVQLGMHFELEMTNSVWGAAGVARKRAYPLFSSFQAFLGTLSQPS